MRLMKRVFMSWYHLGSMTNLGFFTLKKFCCDDLSFICTEAQQIKRS